MEAKESLFVPKETSSATDYVINQVKELLIAGRLKPGDRLPTEFELASSLGVSRGSVRSAMKVFEACGVVDIRRGDGTYICTSLSTKNFNPLILSLAILSPRTEELVTFREKIELDILDLIINSPELSRDVLPKMEENLAELRALQAREGSAEALATNDRAFHKLLAAGCGNSVFEAIYTYIMDFFFPLILDSHYNQDNGAIAAASHFPIYKAVSRRDYAMAKNAIKNSMEYWSGSIRK